MFAISSLFVLAPIRKDILCTPNVEKKCRLVSYHIFCASNLPIIKGVSLYWLGVVEWKGALQTKHDYAHV